MELMIKIIRIMREDPHLGPRLFLLILGSALFGIALMQGINADLWGDSGQYGGGVPAVEEVGK